MISIRNVSHAALAIGLLTFTAPYHRLSGD
jgi:hypothetical protein